VSHAASSAHHRFDVFLSFATADADAVIPIYQSLVSNGKRVFRYDETMPQHGGRSFIDAIDDALTGSKDLVIYWTVSAHASAWVQEEYRIFYSQYYVSDHRSRRLIVFSPDATADALLPAYLRQIQRVRTVTELLKSVGISEAASADLSLQVQSAGIIGAYVSRTFAITDFLPFLAAESNEISLIGSSFLGILREARLDWEESRRIIQAKARMGCGIRILLTHPAVADLRAHQEERRFTEIGREILATARALIEEWKLPHASIRLYVGLPTIFGFKTSAAMLLSPYSYMANTYASPTLIVRRDGFMYDHYDITHFRAWHSAASLPLPENMSDLADGLSAYTTAIASILKTL
jgi:hypothetical protein